MTTPNSDNGKVDEEAAFPLGEISFHNRHHNTTFDDDDNTIPSELSTLIIPSTLTPNYNHYDQQGSTSKLNHSHPSRKSNSQHAESSDIRSRKAFQLAALLGLVSIGALFGTDVVYMMVELSSDDAVPHTISTTMSVNHSLNNLDSTISVRGGRSAVSDSESDTPAQQGGKVSKKTKAKKNKAGKVKDEGKEESSVNHEEEVDEDDNEEDEEEDDNEDDEGTITRTQNQKPLHEGPSLGLGFIEDDSNSQDMAIPVAEERCPHVIQTFEQQNEGVTNMEFLHEKYKHQSVSPSVFYRAGALLFWKDFGEGIWGRKQGNSINLDDLVQLKDAKYEDGTPISPMSTWAWITGDQHLSNFGAWRNRAGEVVFSVNDFDEAAIYDFHIDVLRVAVSICGHGFTNGLNEDQVKEGLEAFTYTYAKTAIDYVGGDSALVYELNPDTSTGVLRDFLWDVQDNRSQMRQMNKFTELGSDGVRRFIRNDYTRLKEVPSEIEEKIRAEITSTRYGASMMKMGWKVRGWDDDFFTVLDIARRVGTGVGSYGVDRFYVLLKGEDMSLEDDQDGASVILDVKYEPVSAVSSILEEGHPETKAWYRDLFRNEADRAAQAQRRLTSYTDPYVGYLVIDGNSYNVRQRSPYKSSFDLGTLTKPRAFNEFIEQIAVATATAHVRGTVAKSPGQFKHVIKLLLAGDRSRRRWSDLVAKIALSYRSQVLLDFECFKDYVETHFPSNE
mmetsp:Transcript_21246/g.46108  ORF Transcript_21246/g.46108 Transcript_21246/m.46108 type:complete len:728 (+) Transcript_21246:314-2497(+)|eukprot:CAMPEP_0172315126 /NCGR_PEP_ID=MMETSP1058-20130122/24147_1 /TAXON_ID=83371 /ORGANISM="Detonula confervacea, Strain CCMP 353" /LENGTH=727 /DNA_ID=CAMNT_0013029133 /DNA_START=206 /DNA_END=2389 /DNA_ORIENTATION=-